MNGSALLLSFFLFEVSPDNVVSDPDPFTTGVFLLLTSLSFTFRYKQCYNGFDRKVNFATIVITTNW